MESKEKIFWGWFAENKHLFENILSNIDRETQPKDIDSAMTLFEENLHKYNENIWFRMGSQNPFELIITAEGNKDNFPFVEKLVKNSPEIENWKIISFIQPQSIDTGGYYYKEGDYELTINDIFFSFSENLSGENGYFLEVMFYVIDDKFFDNDGFKSSIIRIAETATGEYDFAKIVGFINVVPTSETYREHPSGLISLSQFSQKVNEVKSKIK
jgi:hypothetical protein